MAYGKGSVNKVILLGRLGHDPELKYIPSGAAVTKFRIATSIAWKDQDGSPKESTEWHNIIAWRKTAEIASQYLKKGNQVYIEGRLQTRKWNDKNEVTHYFTEIVAENLVLLGSKGDRPAEVPGPPMPDHEFPPVEPDIPPEASEDDLPF